MSPSVLSLAPVDFLSCLATEGRDMPRVKVLYFLGKSRLNCNSRWLGDDAFFLGFRLPLSYVCIIFIGE